MFFKYWGHSVWGFKHLEALTPEVKSEWFTKQIQKKQLLKTIYQLCRGQTKTSFCLLQNDCLELSFFKSPKKSLESCMHLFNLENTHTHIHTHSTQMYTHALPNLQSLPFGARKTPLHIETKGKWQVTIDFWGKCIITNSRCLLMYPTSYAVNSETWDPTMTNGWAKIMTD